jgi:hemoglobin
MRRHIVAALLAVCLWVAPSSAQPSSLYQRLGGYDGVASFVGLVFPRVVQHPALAHFFGGHGNDSQQRQFQMVVELVCARTGGPCHYIGRPMTTVHDGLGISAADWNVFMNIIDTGLAEKAYPAPVRDEFRAIWQAMRDGVLQK